MNFIDYLKENTLQNDSGEDFELNEESLKQYFELFNEKYFNNELPPIELKLTTIKEAKNKYAIGDTKIDTDLEHDKLCVNEIIINENRIHGFIGFRNTLVHEMIHYYVIMKNPPKKYLKNNNDDLKTTVDAVHRILKIEKINSHNGEWLKMANNLNKQFKELNITAVGNGDETLEKGYLEDYILNHKLFLQEKNDEKIIHVITPKSEKYNKLMNDFKNKRTNNKDFIGKWYEILLNDNNTAFEKFIVKYNLFDDNIYTNKDTIEFMESLNLYKKTFICELRNNTINENKRKRKRKRTPEELKELYKKIKNIQYSVETGEIEYKNE